MSNLESLSNEQLIRQLKEVQDWINIYNQLKEKRETLERKTRKSADVKVAIQGLIEQMKNYELAFENKRNEAMIYEDELNRREKGKQKQGEDIHSPIQEVTPSIPSDTIPAQSYTQQSTMGSVRQIVSSLFSSTAGLTPSNTKSLEQPTFYTPPSSESASTLSWHTPSEVSSRFPWYTPTQRFAETTGYIPPLLNYNKHKPEILPAEDIPRITQETQVNLPIETQTQTEYNSKVDNTKLIKHLLQSDPTMKEKVLSALATELVKGTISKSDYEKYKKDIEYNSVSKPFVYKVNEYAPTIKTQERKTHDISFKIPNYNSIFVTK